MIEIADFEMLFAQALHVIASGGFFRCYDDGSFELFRENGAEFVNNSNERVDRFQLHVTSYRTRVFEVDVVVCEGNDNAVELVCEDERYSFDSDGVQRLAWDVYWDL